MLTLILLLILTLLCSAFFSGMEIAFISVNKLEVGVETEQPTRKSQMLSTFFKNPSHFIAATLLGNNIALVFFGILFAKVFDPLWQDYLPQNGRTLWLLLTDTIVSTAFVLIVGEYLPKTLFRLDPLRPLKLFIYPFQFIYWLLILPVYLVIWLTRMFIRFVTGKQAEKEKAVFTRFDLREYIENKLKEHSDDQPSDIDKDMLAKVLDLKTVKARECMVPRNEIVGVERNDELSQIRQLFIESKCSKIIIYEENIDYPVGYLHHHDILQEKIQMHELLFFPETTPAPVIMDTFIKKKKGIAIIVDEYGGTAGLCTLEDVMEEIFGEIKDEYEREEEDDIELQLSPNRFRFSARMEIDYLNEKYEFGLPEDNVYETLAGLILHYNESIPQKGEIIVVENSNFQFEIEKCTPTRIETVQLKINGES